jgi:WD40 repeat protein
MNNNKFQAHEGMITCLDAFDNYLVSAGVDKKVLVWDLRMLDSSGYTSPLRKIVVDDSAILKVAIGPSGGQAAVSTLKGLHLVDFTTLQSKAAVPFKDKRSIGRYHDLKWNTNRNLLYAAGDDQRVDLYTVK